LPELVLAGMFSLHRGRELTEMTETTKTQEWKRGFASETVPLNLEGRKRKLVDWEALSFTRRWIAMGAQRGLALNRHGRNHVGQKERSNPGEVLGGGRDFGS